jgi:hypothetical protein
MSSKQSNVIVYQHQNKQSRSADTNVFFPISTTMLDMGRGARTTSIKTLSTLILHVMCQSFNEINVLVLQNKSLVIIQVNQETLFKQLLIQEKMKELASNYTFYENSQKLTENKILSNGESLYTF